MRNLRKAGVVTVGLVVMASACALDATDDAAESEPVEQVTSAAIESPIDARVGAAIEAQVQNGGLLSKSVWVFACDNSGNLRFRSKSFGWSEWQTLVTGCVSAPTVGAWRADGRSDAIFVYAIFGDSHLHELYWPNAGNFAARAFSDVTIAGNTGALTGTPLITRIWPDQAVDVAIRKVVSNELQVVSWSTFYESWTTRPVLLNSPETGKTTAIVTTDSLSVGSIDGTEFSDTFVTGRGLTSSDTTTAWVAQWKSGPPYYRRTAYAPYDTTASSAPFMPFRDPTTSRHYYFGRFGQELRYREFDPSADRLVGPWATAPGCPVSGRPVRSLHHGTRSYLQGREVLFIRGGSAGDDLIRLASLGEGCRNAGGTLVSAPTPVEYATTDANLKSALYRGSSSRLFFYDDAVAQHVDLNLVLHP